MKNKLRGINLFISDKVKKRPSIDNVKDKGIIYTETLPNTFLVKYMVGSPFVYYKITDVRN